MRAGAFRWLLRRMRYNTPDLIKRIEIQLLCDNAAKVFGKKRQPVCLSRSDKALRKYAEFTADCMRRAYADPEVLFKEAYKLGRAVRRITGFRRQKDCEDLVRWLYRNIGITMEADLPGEVIVHGCFFSRFYTPEQCAVMSNVDSGVISGICGGGRLVFTERITEGCSRCSANYSK